MTKLGLVITDGVGYRNFVLSDFLSKSRTQFEQVVIFSFIPKKVFDEQDGVIIVELKAYDEKFYQWFIRKYKEIAHLRLNSKNNFGIQDNLRKNNNRKISTRGFATQLIYFLTFFLHSESVIQSFERIQFLFFRRQNSHEAFCQVLNENPVDTLLFTHQRPSYIAPLVVAARYKKVKTAAFIFSWDNLASKGRMAASFDYYMVWSDLMKRELLMFYQKIRSEQISVVGTPQFVPYVMNEYQSDKEKFLKKFNLNSEYLTLCYSCGDVSTSPNDPYYIEVIIKAIEEGILPNLNLLVRTSPAESGERFKHLKQKFPRIKWNYPNWNLFRTNHQESWSQRIPDVTDVIDLRAMLSFCDMNINMLSTMSLDFMIHDKPVINPVMGNGENGLGNDQRFLQYEHIRHLIQSGATKIANTPEEMIQHILHYLNKDTDQIKRKAFVDQQIGVPLTQTTKKIIDCINLINS